MYTFRTIELNDAKAFESIRLQEGQSLSSHLFVSAFLWAERLGIQLHLEEDFYVLKRPDGYYFPCGNADKKKAFIEQNIINGHGQLLQLRKEDLLYLEENWPGVFRTTEDRDESEYIYLLHEQIRLVGHKYAQMRKDLRHALHRNGITFEKITKEQFSDLCQINNAWVRKRGKGRELDEADLRPVEKALQYFEELHLEGVVMYKDKQPVAYIISSTINEKMADIHFLKCIDRERGLELCCKQAYYCMLADHYQYVNCEDDMGIEGLRIAKTEAQPIEITYVWKAAV
ncbi:MAG: DUF2156 domain-containing protein [Clostridia bacterium]|nr:DUF2156 domain-containing protein [Clostridia bacterium]